MEFNYKINVIVISYSYWEKCIIKLQLLMKMLIITTRVTSEYFHTHDDLILLIALAALKYETPVFQESLWHRIGHMLIWKQYNSY